MATSAALNTSLLNTSAIPQSIPFEVELGRKINLWAAALEQPFWMASEALIASTVTAIRPGEYGQCEYRVLEILKRILLCAAAAATLPLTLSLALLGTALHRIGDALTGEPFIYLQGTAPEKINGLQQDRFLTLNACLFAGGLPIFLGGMPSGKERIPALAALIKENDPDILCLQEMSPYLSHELYLALKNHYAHFYIDIGSKAFQLESGLFFASKRPIVRPPQFIPFQAQSNGIHRGFFCFETPSAWVVGTHLQSCQSKENQAMRRDQLDQIRKAIQALPKNPPKPCFLMGDLNISRGEAPYDEYTGLKIEEDFIDPYKRAHPIPTPHNATCTGYFTDYRLGKNPPNPDWEWIDYALLAKSEDLPLPKLQTKLIPTFDFHAPERALSDHRGLLLTAKYA